MDRTRWPLSRGTGPWRTTRVQAGREARTGVGAEASRTSSSECQVYLYGWVDKQGRKGGEADLGKSINHLPEQVHALEIRIIVEEDLHKCLGLIAELVEDIEHKSLVLEGAVLAVEDSQEDLGDEDLDLCFQVILSRTTRAKRV